MTDNDFRRVQSLLKSMYPRIALFDSPDSIDLVFNALNRYDFRDTWTGLKNCIENSTYQPNLHEIINSIERAEEIRKDEERRIANAHQTFEEAVSCTKCNDSGYMIVTYRKPTRDAAHCQENDPYDYTEVTRPCSCRTAMQKFPVFFLSDEEWQKWIDDERRKGKNPSSKRPGMKPKEVEDSCGEFYSIRPGRRPQVFTRRKDETSL